MLVPVFSIALMLAGAQTAPPASTAQAQPPQEATTLSTVEVEGQRRTAYEAARAFTNEIVATPPRRGLARWWRTEKVCPGVVNLQRDVAQALADRISDRAAELGLGIGEPGCTANILIVGADDGAAMATEMFGADRSAFRTGVSGTSLTYRALDVFRTSDAPVRWWQLTLPLDARTGTLTVRARNSATEEGIPYCQIDGASRLRTQDINVIYRNLVIVDVNRIGTVDVAQLGDYIAMVSLAQVDAEADLSEFDTVMNLFIDPADVSGMTEWDRAYLRELYAADLSALRASHLGTVAGAMAREEDEAGED